MTELAHAVDCLHPSSFPHQGISFKQPIRTYIKPFIINNSFCEFQKCLDILNSFKNYKKNWDGNDSLPPNLKAIENCKELFKSIFNLTPQLNMEWVSPNITADSNGNIVLEWWEKNKKITLYAGPKYQTIEYIKSSNEKIHDMEDGKLENFTNGSYIPLFIWLYE